MEDVKFKSVQKDLVAMCKSLLASNLETDLVEFIEHIEKEELAAFSAAGRPKWAEDIKVLLKLREVAVSTKVLVHVAAELRKECMKSWISL